MRWLLVKDLQILRRSPLLVGLLIVYPVAIALMIGFALSSPPGKPKVALYSQVAPGAGTIRLGRQQIDVARYARQLFQSIQPLKVNSSAQAVADVRDGHAQAALIVPADIIAQIQSLLTTGFGSPTVYLILNTTNPLERQLAEQAIGSRLAEVEQAVSRQVLRIAVNDLHEVLDGGTLSFAGQSVQLLGLRVSRSIVEGAIAALPPGSPFRAALRQVVAFANLAITGLAFAGPVLGAIGSPITVDQRQLAGRTSPIDSYAVAIAVTVSLMMLALVLAAGLLAIEHSQNAYPRLVRGLITPGRLLCEKIVLAAACAAVVALLMAAFVSLFVHLEWTRFELWVLALTFAGLAFGALGVAIGGIAKDLSAASLMALLVSLPIAFVALVPASAVAGGVRSALDTIAFAFPFKAALEAAGNAFSGAAPGMVGPLAHLAVLTLVFAALARLAVRRFG